MNAPSAREEGRADASLPARAEARVPALLGRPQWVASGLVLVALAVAGSAGNRYTAWGAFAGFAALFALTRGFGDPDEGGEARPVSIPIPDIEEFSARERMAMEKETSGLYLTGHPMDEYRAAVKKIGASPIGAAFRYGPISTIFRLQRPLRDNPCGYGRARCAARPAIVQINR